MADESYIGAGKIYIAPLTDGAQSDAARHVGNCSLLNFSIEQDKKDLMDYTNCAGGKANSYSRITGVTANMTLYDINGENLALALRGTTSAHTSASQSAEAQTAWTGGFTRTTYIPTGSTIVVKDESDSTTYTAGTDYNVVPGGITIPASGSSIGDGATIHISYTSQASDMVEALTAGSTEYKLYFAGLNKAQECDPLLIEVFRFKPDPTTGFEWLGDDFSALELTGEVLIDESITTSGLSQYFTVDKV